VKYFIVNLYTCDAELHCIWSLTRNFWPFIQNAKTTVDHTLRTVKAL